MLSAVPAPTVVLLIVGVAWAAGTAVFAALTRLGGQVQAGHFKVCWLVVAGIALGSSFVGDPGWPALTLAVLALLTYAGIYVRGADRPLGVVAAIAGLVLMGVTVLRTTGSTPISVTVGIATAWMLGAVTNSMLLGHWHLNQPRLGTGPLRLLVWILWGGLAAFIASVTWLAVTGWGDGSAAAFGAVTAIAFTSFSLILTAMVQHLVKTRSIMSATGILYLLILMAFVSAFTGVLGSLALPEAV